MISVNFKNSFRLAAKVQIRFYLWKYKKIKKVKIYINRESTINEHMKEAVNDGRQIHNTRITLIFEKNYSNGESATYIGKIQKQKYMNRKNESTRSISYQ